MKKTIQLLVLMLAILPAISFSQEKKAAWPEMKAFHAQMSSTFHPAEAGNLKPLREKADSLYIVVKLWQATAIPSNFKPTETTAALKKLTSQCAGIKKAVDAKASDKDLTVLITAAHDTFHMIAGECKKADD
jgi:hypothetical protein